MDTNEALTILGPRNRYILKWYCIIGLAKGITSCFSMLSFFFGAMPPKDFHCRLPPNVSVEEAIPKEFVKGKWRYSQCNQYSNFTANSTIVPCEFGYDYFDTYVKTSIITDWDLVCDNEIWNQLAVSSFFITSIIGSVCFGALADKFGRKPIFLILVLALGVLLFATAFSSNIYVYIFFRVLTGCAQQGSYVTGFCLLVELFPVHLRTIPSILDQFFWTLGCFIMVAVAYYVRYWNYYFISLSVPFLVLIVLFFFLPESIPWLVSHGKLEEAKKQLKRALKEGPDQGVQEDVFDNLANMPANQRKFSTTLSRRRSLSETEKSLNPPESPSKVDHYNVWFLFQHKVLLRWTLVNIVIWPVTSISFFAVQMKAMDLGDPYLNFLLTSVIELPAYIIILPILKKCGRKVPLSAMYLSTALCVLISYLFSIYITSTTWPTIAILLVGRLIISAVFAVIFLYTAEMFPTSLRSVAVGVSTGICRIGVSIAPFLFLLEKYNSASVYIILVVIGCLASFLTLCLPETKHRSLPDKIEEIELWVQNKSWIHFKRANKESPDMSL